MLTGVTLQTLIYERSVKILKDWLDPNKMSIIDIPLFIVIYLMIVYKLMDTWFSPLILLSIVFVYFIRLRLSGQKARRRDILAVIMLCSIAVYDVFRLITRE